MLLQFVIDWAASPEIFNIGSFSLRWYPLMFVVGFFVGLQIMTKIYQNEGKDIKELDTLLAVMLFAAIIGARIGHYLFYDWQLIFTNPIEVFLPIELEPSTVFGIEIPFSFVGFRGLASHGAVFTILPALYWFSRKYKHNYFWLLDRIVITVAFAAIFIRIGNFFNHEIVGSVISNPDSVPWAVKFKYHANDWMQNIYRHPAQLYESLCYLITFLSLVAIYKKSGARTPYGKLFGLFMMMIFGARFLIEFLKEEQNGNDVGVLQATGLNIGQLLSIPMILIGIYFYFFYAPNQGKKQMEADLK